jgi:hypothetical protein
VTLAEQWDGSTWAAQAVPEAPGSRFGDYLTAVSCAAAGCVAVGGDNDAIGQTVPLGAAWNGSTWQLTPVPLPSGATTGGLAAVSCTAAAACTAVGWYSGGTGHKALAETWNGAHWRVQPTASPASQKALRAVSCTAPGGCTAVGTSFALVNGHLQPLAEGE